jgi:hypothetical protein
MTPGLGGFKDRLAMFQEKSTQTQETPAIVKKLNQSSDENKEKSAISEVIHNLPVSFFSNKESYQQAIEKVNEIAKDLLIENMTLYKQALKNDHYIYYGKTENSYIPISENQGKLLEWQIANDPEMKWPFNDPSKEDNYFRANVKIETKAFPREFRSLNDFLEQTEIEGAQNSDKIKFLSVLFPYREFLQKECSQLTFGRVTRHFPLSKGRKAFF